MRHYLNRYTLTLLIATILAIVTFIPSVIFADHDETHLVAGIGPERSLTYPHGSFTTDTNACGQCHQLHRGKEANLLRAESKRDTCFICHDGRGSKYDEKNGKYYNAVKGVITEGVAGGFNEKSGFTSKHLIEEVNAPPGGTGQAFMLVCTSCHNPHGTSNHRNIQTKVNGRSGVVVQASISNNPFTGQEVISYENGIPNFCSSCHKDYVYYHNDAGVNDPTKYRHPIGAKLNGGTRVTDSADGESPKSAKFDPTLFTTLPTEGVPSGAYPKPSTVAAAGGTLNGQYHYIVTSANSIGESHEGYVKSVTSPANGKVTLEWDSITNALSYSVYRAAGAKPSGTSYLNSYKLIASSNNVSDKSKFSYSETPDGGKITFIDTGYSVGTKSPPAINSQTNPAKVFCLTCHFAHGTKSVDGFTGQSKLKRIDNMGVCQNCHKR